MRLLTAPVNEIQWLDVQHFCDAALPEGVTRDYKEDFPTELERTVAAMANSAGGLVLIGVTEDRKSTKPSGMPGIPLIAGLHERVLNICISNIAPIVTPEVAVVPDPSSTHAVLVLRIPQSAQAPHAIARNTKVYVRRGSISNPEEYATLDELDWLRRGREKSVAFRETLLARANDRFWQFLRGFHETRLSRELERDGMLQLAFSPAYPEAMIRKPPELQELMWKTRVRDYYGTDEKFPIGPFGGVLVQDGLVQQSAVGHTEWAHHTEVNSFGLLFFKQTLLHKVVLGEKTVKLIRASEVFSRLDEMFDWAKGFYEAAGYVGALTFSMCLENLIGSPLGKYTSAETALELEYCPDPVIEFTASTSTATFAADKPRLVLEAAQRMAWAYGWDLKANLLDHYYKRYKGQSVVGV
jgi:hypothetical protein